MKCYTKIYENFIVGKFFRYAYNNESLTSPYLSYLKIPPTTKYSSNEFVEVSYHITVQHKWLNLGYVFIFA